MVVHEWGWMRMGEGGWEWVGVGEGRWGWGWVRVRVSESVCGLHGHVRQVFLCQSLSNLFHCLSVQIGRQ